MLHMHHRSISVHTERSRLEQLLLKINELEYDTDPVRQHKTKHELDISFIEMMLCMNNAGIELP